MKKIITITLLSVYTIFAAKAQLTDGSIAKDFTLKDINGKSHNLHSYLNEGKTVAIDFSATWCGPCWDYHESGALETIWTEHGPKGETGVNANTTNDMIVFFIEGDPNTTINQLKGQGTTQGDWVKGTLYPIFNPADPECTKIAETDYKISYFPTCYLICPDKTVTLIDQWQASEIYEQHRKCLKPTEVSETRDEESFAVFPNPATSQVKLNYTLTEQSLITVSLINSLGQQIFLQSLGVTNVGTHHYDIETSALENGIYLLNIAIDGRIINKRIVINR